MGCTRRNFLALASGAALVGMTACAKEEVHEEVEQPQPEEQDPQPVEVPEEPEVDLREYEGLELDMTAWKYDDNNDVYYQLGVPYCLKPCSEQYESLAIFVPGAYFRGEKHHNDTYACEVNGRAVVGDFTPLSAPVVMPINMGTLGSQASPTSYASAGLEGYLSMGCVYVYAGFRGRTSGYDSAGGGAYVGGAPWPVVDLKAAIRFLRYNAHLLPADLSRIFTFGFSMGGGVSAVLGASGDSELYAPYFEEIGAAMHDAEGDPISDATFASASWCPVTSFDMADASYEWMMGQFATDGGGTRAEGTWTRMLSTDLANAYGSYVNGLHLTDQSGADLTLDETMGEQYAAGTYYEHLLMLVQDAAADFLATTPFPYTYTPQYLVNAGFPGDPGFQSLGSGSDVLDVVTGDASAQAAGANAGEGTTTVQSVVYATVADYVNALNGDAWWLTYNQSRGAVSITSLGDFVRHLKSAVKGVCAFDAVDRSTVENQLFGVEDASSLHFSEEIRDLLANGATRYAEAAGWDKRYVEDWTQDLVEVDSLGAGMGARMDMLNPLYYLCDYYEGVGSSVVAPHWRINAGLFQTDTSLCTEANLALALGAHKEVKDLAFTPVWGQGHVLAETSGTAEENLLAWIRSCCKD